ncbi:hypothetical protein L1887_29775 [Cichorium endivia]|nr:hypothetical protein L1887_29775 [Cichorium endivia]
MDKLPFSCESFSYQNFDINAEIPVEIAGKIYKVIVEEGRKDLGQIEQDLMFSDARNKELLEFLEDYEDPNIESRLTLMMIYALADPEKCEGDNGKDI